MGRFTSSEMEPGDFTALSIRRAARARQLAAGVPEARTLLEFFARLAEFQARVDGRDPLAGLPSLVELSRECGPPALRSMCNEMDRARCRLLMDEYLATADASRPQSFFARVLLMPAVVVAGARTRSSPVLSESKHACPRCGHPPQVGSLVPDEQGTKLVLTCSLCLTRYDAPRARCVTCGQTDEQRLSYYHAEGARWEAVVCEACGHYMHLVQESSRDAVADVDEVAGIVLDVWAQERGYRKVHPNLMGV